MIDEMYKKTAGDFIVTEGKKGWFVSLTHQCLCEVDFAKRQGRILKYLGYTEKGLEKYRGVVKYRERLYVYPSCGDNIAIFDLEGNEIKTISIKLLVTREEGAKIRTACVYDKYIFFMGNEYQAIIRLDTETEKLDYITDWVETVESRVNDDRELGYIAGGVLINSGKIYCPIGCIPAIIELEPVSLNTRMISLETEVGGIVGITPIKDDIYCLTCGENKANRILIWDMVTNTVKEEKEFYTPIELCLPTYAGIRVGEKIFWGIIDWWLKEFNEFDIKTSELKKNTILSELDYGSPGTSRGCYVTMAVFAEDDKILHFATGKDFRWHEYNVETNELISYDIIFEGTEDIYQSIFSDMMMVNAYLGGLVKENIVPLEGLIKCVLEY